MNAATLEQVISFLIGCAFGYVLHIIVSVVRGTKEEVDELLDRERKRDEAGLLEHRVAFNVIFATMIIFVFYSAYASFQNGRHLERAQEDNFAALCRSGEESRTVQRKTVDAIYQLAISAIQKDPEPPYTPAQIIQINSYIDRTNAFRARLYQQIRPTKECMEYVTDDNVDPPTPPQPHIK